MRSIALAVVVLVVGCASSEDGSPPCELVGTYELIGTGDGRSTCPSSGGAPKPTLVTVSDRGGGRLVAEIQGVSGSCPATAVGSCGWQTKCDGAILDATGPQKSGTVQISVSVEGSKARGTVATYVPPSTSIPPGCEANGSVTGSRK